MSFQWTRQFERVSTSVPSLEVQRYFSRPLRICREVVNYKMGRKKRPKGRDEISVSCLKCGHKHIFDSASDLESTDISTPCLNCGFPFLQHLANKIDATMALLKSDPRASALLREGKLEEFKKYLEEETGLI